MSIIGDIAGIFSAGAAAKAQKEKNALLAQQYGDQQLYAGKETDVANSLTQYIQALANRGVSSYYTPLDANQQGIQNASYGEELARNTVDQAQRRGALQDTERLRQQASSESDQALRDYDNLLSGVGKIDPVQLANQIRLSRTAAVNAGYDDANHAAQTLSLRTGTDAGAALSEIARNRTKDIASTLGDPYTDALTAAQSLNDAKLSDAASAYNLFNQKANNFYDSSFAPSNYAQTAVENAQKSQALDLQKYDTLFGGITNQGSLIGNAAGNLNRAANTQDAQTNYNTTAPLITAIGNGVQGIGQSVASAATSGGDFNLSSLGKMFFGG